MLRPPTAAAINDIAALIEKRKSPISGAGRG
jgi:hypothetical protein